MNGPGRLGSSRRFGSGFRPPERSTLNKGSAMSDGASSSEYLFGFLSIGIHGTEFHSRIIQWPNEFSASSPSAWDDAGKP